jgi:glycosyltransferase involved in cell wall biosynthesis
MNQIHVALVMPVYNEADGITEFLDEIDKCLQGAHVIVIDDCSADETVQRIQEFEPHNIVVSVLSNEKNLGHGPSTLRALSEGVNCGAEVIVTSDGDGQISGADLRQLVDDFEVSNCAVMVGVRIGRSDTAFRALTSWVTRVITCSRAKRRVLDANSPFRVYEPRILERMLSIIPSASMVPNLWMTVIAHRLGVDFRTTPVQSRDRRGSSGIGSTWGQRFKVLPSRRFVRFCFRASTEWFRVWREVQRSLRGEM